MSTALASLHQDLRDLVGRTIADRYRIDALLGSGGMGAVFKGHHLGLERDVAIKVLHPALGRDPEISERFDREARSASRLDHPNCVSVTDYGSTEDQMKFMVMQLLEGGELCDLLGKPLPPLRACELVLQILSALEHAHAQGVVHRDIKPENVFITRDRSGRETLKLVDFGIAKIMTAEGGKKMTKVGLVFGTPAYMSPEQAAGIEADERADLYSVGVIFYEMLSGQPPFDSPDPVALVRMQITTDPPPLPPDVPPVLAACVERLLTKNRVERFQTATEVRETLESVAAMLRGDTGPGSIEFPVPLTSSVELASGPLTGSITGPAATQIGSATMPSIAPRRSGGGWLWLFSAAALGAVGWWTLTREPQVVAEVAAYVGEVRAAEPDAAATDAAAVAGDTAGPDTATLAEIDRLIQAGALDDADKLLTGLRGQFPEDPQLAWRTGRILTKRKNKKAQALVAYGHALVADAALLEDKHFYAELHDLMQIPALRDEALALALDKMGKYGHPFLLTLVNNEKKPLPYESRQRALEELGTDPASWALVNSRLNIALDLLQAKQSPAPCQAYDEALTNVAAMPDYWFYSRVERAEVPPVDANAKSGREDPVLCATLPQRKADTLALLATLAPEGTAVPPADGDASAGTSKPAAKPQPKRSSRKKSDCNKFRGIFKKRCW